MTRIPALCLITCLLVCPGASFAFQAEVFPQEISPGDSFLITVHQQDEAPEVFFGGRRFYFSDCGEGCFIAVGAADLDTKPGEYTVTLRQGETEEALRLRVKEASFPTIRLTLPPSKVFVSLKDLKRVERENEKLSLIWQTVSGRLWDGSFILPLGNEISSAFGTMRIMNGKKKSVHTGIDIRGKAGEEVRASNTGVVVLSEELFFGGNTVVIDHGQGIFSVCMHLKKFNSGVGDIVKKGDVIGFVGSTGRADGPHLHFGIKVLDINTNPVSFIGLKM
ncbi:MAG: M23 family metallopeptidase [Thermodesulfovibrionales bacterium]|nr:M23 family metallopeptidase [Thermodesulfovibrionales bacterium]